MIEKENVKAIKLGWIIELVLFGLVFLLYVVSHSKPVLVMQLFSMVERQLHV
jgi:hypothetical protein